jgi:serine protease AprX
VLGYSMMKVVRQFSRKLDRQLRSSLVHLYRPMRWTPCFMHSMLEKGLKKYKRFPVIVEFDDCNYSAGVSDLEHTVKRHGRCRMKHEYASISACSVHLTADAIEELLDSCSHVKRIHDDRKVTALLNKANPSIKADTLNDNGLTGKGIQIAVIDTGIYPHQDLTRPTNRIVAFKDFVGGRLDPYDDNGHGTHCAGDAAGNGFASGGTYSGPAPEANVLGVKVLDRQGSGSLSNVMAGIEWCIVNKDRYDIHIISLSLGSQAQQPAADDPMVKIVEKAWEAGIVVCAAAGNEGPDERTIASPGISPKIITVGAMNDHNTVERSDDTPADFSSRGPTIDGLVKPDLLAPGVSIVSLRSPNSNLDKSQKSNRVGDQYFTLSGTSMATPICAGVAALLLQHSPALTPDEVKQRLLQGAEDRGLSPYTQGQGYLNAEKALPENSL